MYTAYLRSRHSHTCSKQCWGSTILLLAFPHILVWLPQAGLGFNSNRGNDEQGSYLLACYWSLQWGM